ncbi:hypothetical protein [Lysobacter korlensis]
MRVRRARSSAAAGTFGGDGTQAHPAISDWFDELGAEIASRTDPLLAAYARARLTALAGQLRIVAAPTTPAAFMPARGRRNAWPEQANRASG